MTIDLKKRTESVRVILAKRSILTAPVMRVGLALDITGSAKPLYENGTIQEVTDRLLAVAAQFDDNGEMDMWSFTTGYDRLKSATASDYGRYVQKNIMDNGKIAKWGSTRYSPVLSDMYNFYFGSKGGLLGMFAKKSTLPALGLFITDGQNESFDEAATERVFIDSQKSKIYWSLVGVGNPQYFAFLERMADKYPNVGFMNFSSLAMTDEQLYEQLITDELCAWAKQVA